MSSAIAPPPAPPPAPPAEQTIFDEAGVRITNIRFVSGTQTYAMSGVTSVGTSAEHPSTKGPVIAILFGLLIVFIALRNLSTSVGPLFVGLVICGVGIIVFIKRVPVYSVLLHSASGERKATSSKDQAFIGRIVTALNEAIVMRG